MIAPSPAKSPFKFLEAYNAGDKDRFFGREAEQQRLIELIFRSRLQLVYGQSGTGKTSLVQCGLAKVLASSDYFPILIRRRANFLTSLETTLGGLLGDPEQTDVVAMVTQLARFALRPVYLIFDQFEELFISGDRSEQQQFFTMLNELYQSATTFKLLIVMREDYIAYLYAYEEIMPNLFDFRLRVEPMSEKNLNAVIVGTCQQAGIELDQEVQSVRLIIDNNQSPKNPFQLPYLQVYLDRLWRTATDGRSDYETAPVKFDPALIEKVGKIEDVLVQFIDDQILTISDQLPEPDGPAVKMILETLVTYEGTRRESTVTALATETGLAPSLVSQCAEALEAARILQFENGSYELAHDSLAKVIDKGRSSEQRQINDILKRLKEAWQEYTTNGKADDLLLPQRRLSEIQLYETAIHNSLTHGGSDGAEILQYIAASSTFLEKKRQADLIEQRQKNNRLRQTIAGVSVLLALAIFSVVIAFIKYREAAESDKKSQATLNLVQLQRAGVEQSTGLRYIEFGEFELAEESFQRADSLLKPLLEDSGNIDFPEGGKLGIQMAAESRKAFALLEEQLPRQLEACRKRISSDQK
jgi:hypothetical protein